MPNNNNDILNEINNNKWESVLKATNEINLFDPISADQKNLFHYACMRGQIDVINTMLSIDSQTKYLTDTNGNTGAHLLAIGGWDNILLDILNREPLFLKLKIIPKV